MTMHRRELKVISRGLDLCEGTLCSDVAEVRTWVTSTLEEQQKMVLCMMSEMVRLGKAIEESGRVRGAGGEGCRGGRRVLWQAWCAEGRCFHDEEE